MNRPKCRIPDVFRKYDLSQIIDLCKRVGYGNDFVRWTEIELDESGVGAKNTRNIIGYKHGSVDSIENIRRVFGANFDDYDQWSSILNIAHKKYRDRYEYLSSMAGSITPEIAPFEIQSPDHVAHLHSEGHWIYTLARHSGQPFDDNKEHRLLVGYFTVSDLKIKHAKNFWYCEREGILKFNASWYSIDFAEGFDCIFIMYSSNNYISSRSKSRVGIIRARDERQRPIIGTASMHGEFWDLNTSSNEDSGEFYCERVSGLKNVNFSEACIYFGNEAIKLMDAFRN
ncbi:MAG: hypothetical protein ACE37J_02570 [Pikeienuella sp.]|uniref:hypothetical protein n=1 Tax=Pikeienuella sp. TaxID=2831957 RepID=UPI00391BF30F